MYAHKQKIILCLCLAFFFAISPHFCCQSGAFSAEPSAPAVHTFDVGISPEDYRTLISDTSEPKLTAFVSADGAPFVSGAIKLRGQASKAWGIGVPQKRIPIQFNFNFSALEKTINNTCIKLINSITPFHLIAEYMAFDLFSYCGIPTPAHGFIFLRYNDVDFGLYLAVENVNNAFLSKHFSAPLGTLYKVRWTAKACRFHIPPGSGT